MFDVPIIRNGIAGPLRPYLDIISGPIPDEFEPFIRAFWEATEVLTRSVKITKNAYAVISPSYPVTMNMEHGQLAFNPPEYAVHTYVEHLIFFDCQKSFGFPHAVQVAGILEELCHVFMNVYNETVVPYVVCSLYREIRFFDGKYQPHPIEEGVG